MKLQKYWNSSCCVVVGDRQVGKTSLIQNLCKVEIAPKQKSSIISTMRKSRMAKSDELSDTFQEMIDLNMGFGSKTSTVNCSSGVVNIKFWEISS